MNEHIACLKLSADWCYGFLIVEDTPWDRQDGLDCIGLDMAKPGDKLIVERLTMTRKELDALPGMTYDPTEIARLLSIAPNGYPAFAKAQEQLRAAMTRIRELENVSGWCAYCEATVPPAPKSKLRHFMRDHVESCEKHPLAQARTANHALAEALEFILSEAKYSKNNFWIIRRAEEALRTARTGGDGNG